MKRLVWLLTLWVSFGTAIAAETDISLDLRMDEIDYVRGERLRGVVSVKNMSPDILSVGYTNSTDQLFVEVYRAADMEQLDILGTRPFVSRFRLDLNTSRKFEVFLLDHYDVQEYCRYLAKPVLIHSSRRYEGQFRAFDIVPGMDQTSALQIFANHSGLSREFKLVRWSRKGHEHLFIKAVDQNQSDRSWETRDLGVMMRITEPTLSVLPSGEVIVLHRSGPDTFTRSEFWSLPSILEFRRRDQIQDPETAGQSRVGEIYNEAGGVKPKVNPWWKFW